ncbi:MAG: hypothetical protein QOH10_1013 [Actinomycetota bacterium]|nr:hypothetical protein [Actinomycetota bacterium]
MSKDTTSRLNAAPVDAVEYIVGSLADTKSDGDYEAVFIAAVGKAGEVVFYGTCENSTLTRPLQGFATLHAITPLKALVEILSDRSGTTATDFFANGGYAPPVKWVDKSPDARSLDPADTPASILAKLSSQAIYVSVPAEWLPTTWLVCAKSSEGWGDCSDITRAASVVDTSQALALLVRISFDPGTGYDLVLKHGAGFDAKRRPLVAIGAETAARQDSIRVVVLGTVDNPKAEVFT